jgi:hypothetical protein
MAHSTVKTSEELAKNFMLPLFYRLEHKMSRQQLFSLSKHRYDVVRDDATAAELYAIILLR